ncbi:hypothetical protein AGOR_G00093350 [Albula goreensis]|uniref:Uncharacterized protein n=1 Tax=Albula goreensis TaxID=1534307 RepID=A0A8T3DMV3_9TELE|nr:hypothetical protein AGOR_G00093350 [Albula goreensis]
MTCLMLRDQCSSLWPAIKHIGVLVLLTITGLITNLIFYSTMASCLCDTNIKSVIFLAILGPFLALLALAVGLQKRNIFCNMKSTLLRKASFWKSIFLSVYPSVYWVAMLMIDSRYYVCYKTCEEKVSKDSFTGNYGRYDYYGHNSPKNSQELRVQSQLIGYSLIVVLAALVLLYLCCERCCRPTSWRLEELREHALEEGKQECAERYALAFAKHVIGQHEVHLYETPLNQDPNKTLPASAAPASIPRGLAAHVVVNTINRTPINTVYG